MWIEMHSLIVARRTHTQGLRGARSGTPPKQTRRGEGHWKQREETVGMEARAWKNFEVGVYEDASKKWEWCSAAAMAAAGRPEPALWPGRDDASLEAPAGPVPGRRSRSLQCGMAVGSPAMGRRPISLSGQPVRHFELRGAGYQSHAQDARSSLVQVSIQLLSQSATELSNYEITVTSVISHFDIV